MLPGLAPYPSPAAVGLSVLRTDTKFVLGPATSFTVTVDIGAPDPDRIVMLTMLGVLGGRNTTITSVTIDDGTSTAVALTAPIDYFPTQHFYVFAPTGTTMKVTFTTSVAWNEGFVSAIRVVGWQTLPTSSTNNGGVAAGSTTITSTFTASKDDVAVSTWFSNDNTKVPTLTGLAPGYQEIKTYFYGQTEQIVTTTGTQTYTITSASNLNKRICTTVWRGVTPDVDSLWNKVFMLNQFEGALGATPAGSIADNSSVNNALTHVTPASGTFDARTPVTGGQSWFTTSGSRFYLTDASRVSITGDYTWEMAIYPTDTGTQRAFGDLRIAATTGNPGPLLFRYNTGEIGVYDNDSYRIKSAVIPANAWTWVCLERYNGVYKLYINGVKDGVDYAQTSRISDTFCLIGSEVNGAQVFAGGVAQHRLTLGEARYKGNYAVPTRPFPRNGNAADLGLINLFHFDNVAAPTTIVDSSPRPRLITPAAGAGVDASAAKFGAGGLPNPGAAASNKGITVSAGARQPYNFAQKPWTFDLWYKPPPTTVAWQQPFGYDTPSSTAGWFGLLLNGQTGVISWYEGVTARITVSGKYVAGQWVHLAVSRQGNNVRLFVNGVLEGTYVTSYAYGGTAGILVGQQNGINQPAADIDEFRVSNYARWTANFTPPTGPDPT